MENFNFIEFHRTRDFSRKLNATFEFVKQNFKSAGQEYSFYCWPSHVSGKFGQRLLYERIHEFQHGG